MWFVACWCWWLSWWLCEDCVEDCVVDTHINSSSHTSMGWASHVQDGVCVVWAVRKWPKWCTVCINVEILSIFGTFSVKYCSSDKLDVWGDLGWRKKHTHIQRVPWFGAFPVWQHSLSSSLCTVKKSKVLCSYEHNFMCRETILCHEIPLCGRHAPNTAPSTQTRIVAAPLDPTCFVARTNSKPQNLRCNFYVVNIGYSWVLVLKFEF
jgi:hypothetical protein